MVIQARNIIHEIDRLAQRQSILEEENISAYKGRVELQKELHLTQQGLLGVEIDVKNQA